MRYFPLFALILASACAQKGADAPRSDTAPAVKQAFKVETIASGLEFPWGITFLPDGSALITEKAGRVRQLKDGKLGAPINGLPKDILYDGQGGLLDIAAAPDFAKSQIVYISYSKGTENENATTLIRAKFDGEFKEVTEIYSANPKKKGTAHFGGRIIFVPDNSLLLSVGEGFNYKEEAQNLKSNLGKIIKINLETQKAEVFSYGHRNPQGLAYDANNKIIYENEHGPRGGDEINVLAQGKNYGWPKITYGIDYSGLKISDYVALPGMEQPITYWVPSIAPSSMLLYTGDMFPQFKGDLLVSALAGQQLRHVDLENGKIVKETVYLSELETRFRNVTQAPDGSIWILTDEPEGKVLRVSGG